MCNACGFQCCAYDGFSGCGCDHCDEPDCRSDAVDGDDDVEGDGARPGASDLSRPAAEGLAEARS